MTEQPSPEVWLTGASMSLRQARDWISKGDDTHAIHALFSTVEAITMALGRPPIPMEGPTEPASATRLPWKTEAAAAVDSMMLDRDAAIEDRDNARAERDEALAERDRARDLAAHLEAELDKYRTWRDPIADLRDRLALQHVHDALDEAWRRVCSERGLDS